MLIKAYFTNRREKYEQNFYIDYRLFLYTACIAARFDDLSVFFILFDGTGFIYIYLTILGSKNIVLTIWRFMFSF